MREGLDQLNHSVLNDELDVVAELKSRLLQQSQVLSEKVAASIVAFQFYDKLSQRLQHVSKSLSSLSDIISHEERTVDEAKWNSFLEKMEKYGLSDYLAIKQKYFDQYQASLSEEK